MARAINWIGTISLERFNREELIGAFTTLSIKYAVYQLECGEDTGYPHWQVYLISTQRIRINGLRAATHNSHWEIRKGTHQQAKEYCSKEETRLDGPFYYGEEPVLQPGKRTDLDNFKRSIQDGCEDTDLWNDHFATMLRYHRSLPAARAALQLGREARMAPKVFVLWGPTGSGKSARAEALAREKDQIPYRVSAPATANQPVWWDGYVGQKFVIFDDFYGWYRFAALLKLLDRYWERVDYRGGSTNFNGETVCFTSNVEPRKWYPRIEDNRFAALERRFTHVTEVLDLNQDVPDFPSLDFV